MNTYEQERQKELWNRRHWMGPVLVEANSYADALRFSDLLDDGLTIEEAAKDSGAEFIEGGRGS